MFLFLMFLSEEKSPEQIQAAEKARCYQVQYTNGRDVEMCNKID